jgi:hypothetical protein
VHERRRDPLGVRRSFPAQGAPRRERGLPRGEAVRLGPNDEVGTGRSRHLFRPAHPGYEGLLLADTDTRLGVSGGQVVELGREPNHPGLAYADRKGQDNLRWCSGPRAAQARSGGFTLDRGLVGRRQAAVQVLADQIHVASLHPRCPTFVLPADGAELRRIDTTARVQVDDLIVAGTSVVALRDPNPR